MTTNLTFYINSTRLDHNDVEQAVSIRIEGTYHSACGPSWDDPGCPSEFDITGATGENGEDIELTDDEIDDEYEQNDPSDFDSDED